MKAGPPAPQACLWGVNVSPSLCFQENDHWNQLIEDAQKRGAIIKTCDKNYRHDATKILKPKPVLQRSLTHPPTIGLEASPDGEFSRTAVASSLYHSPSDCRDATVTASDPERPPIQDRLRDPRLLRRMGLSPEAKGRCSREPQPSSPQQPGAALPPGEAGFSGSLQDPAGPGQQPTAKGAAPNLHRPQAQGEPAAAGTDASTSKRKCDPEEGSLSHRRETRAFSEGGPERRGSVRHHAGRDLGSDEWGPQKEDGGWKKRRLS